MINKAGDKLLTGELKELEKEIETISKIYPKDEETSDYLSFLFRQRGKILLGA